MNLDQVLGGSSNDDDLSGDVDVAKVNTLLRQLEGHAIDFYSYARDTPKGKDCICMLEYCRASELTLEIDSSVQTGNGNSYNTPMFCWFSQS